MSRIRALLLGVLLLVSVGFVFHKMPEWTHPSDYADLLSAVVNEMELDSELLDASEIIVSAPAEGRLSRVDVTTAARLLAEAGWSSRPAADEVVWAGGIPRLEGYTVEQSPPGILIVGLVLERVDRSVFRLTVTQLDVGQFGSFAGYGFEWTGNRWRRAEFYDSGGFIKYPCHILMERAQKASSASN